MHDGSTLTPDPYIAALEAACVQNMLQRVGRKQLGRHNVHGLHSAA